MSKKCFFDSKKLISVYKSYSENQEKLLKNIIAGNDKHRRHCELNQLKKYTKSW